MEQRHIWEMYECICILMTLVFFLYLHLIWLCLIVSFSSLSDFVVDFLLVANVALPVVVFLQFFWEYWAREWVCSEEAEIECECMLFFFLLDQHSDKKKTFWIFFITRVSQCCFVPWCHCHLGFLSANSFLKTKSHHSWILDVFTTCLGMWTRQRNMWKH